MQILTRRFMVAIENYDHMKTTDENVKWIKLTHLLSKKLSNVKAPFYTYTFAS